MNLNKIIKIALSIIFSTVIMYFLVRSYNISSIQSVIYSLVYWKIFLGLTSMIAMFLLCGYRWVYIYHQYSFKTSFNSVIISQAANSLLPLRSGEIIRAILLKNETGIPVMQTMGRIIIERLLDFITLLCMLIVTIMCIGIDARSNELTFLIFGGILITVLLCALIIYKKYYEKIDSILYLIQERYKILYKLIHKLIEMLDVIKHIHYHRIILAQIMTFIISFGGIIMLWFFLRGCGIEISLFYTMLLYPLITLSISIPVTIGYIGVFHGTLLAGLYYIGITDESILSKVIVIHLLTVVPALIYGWIIIMRYHLEIGKIFQVNKNNQL